ncbi:RAB6-interacting golgin [Arabidopsis thaliana x Arabidopsis arenosa]|uniref:RAB6-interacting golgin n=1 Tax=Arabidopsis thaliana x Arabidopsis arenosa TaxID=1240361 RepID=A0A8T2AZD3_9BRAS|nr:RAB6-interacting golgin [Arabidopsis thaliana x Arabidopsis arenosa]
MASTQYGFDHQGGVEIINDELIMSFLEEESPVENHSSINKEEEEKLNRVIRSLEVEINMSSPTIEARKMDMQQTITGLEDDFGFGWLNDFDIGALVYGRSYEKEVYVVHKKIDSVNKELKPLGSTVQKKACTYNIKMVKLWKLIH